ncbi:hypothetical protein FA95DRAFT_1345815 [Auriscalpium vulgare]|uniref:Uncharacterized protein n=1 Tax=Auriscalpium vulgare TaxID=40419 RepID=A0ACB8RS55_9AGAM|nr:hypothetical protein FA95DRAFT_1345815 [Auriscalpium vulgare]
MSCTVDPADLSLARIGRASGPLFFEDATAFPWSHGATPLVMGDPISPSTPLSDCLSPSNYIAFNEERTDGTPTVVSKSNPSSPSQAPCAPPLQLPDPPAHSPRFSESPVELKPALRCPRCPFVQQNGRAYDLERHIKTHDPNRPKFACGHRGCGETFSRKDAVRRHHKNVNAKCATAQGDDV